MVKYTLTQAVITRSKLTEIRITSYERERERESYEVERSAMPEGVVFLANRSSFRVEKAWR